MKRALAYLFTLILLVTSVGCAKFLGSLRKDLDDTPPMYRPTVGGTWPEGGLLDPYPRGQYAAVGHVDRRLASQPADPYRSLYFRDTWVSQDQYEQNRRDAYRVAQGYQQSFSQNPNMPPSVARNYRTQARKTRDDFVDSAPNEGSLWGSHGQTNYFFVKNRVRAVGDIVNMKIGDRLVQDIALEVRKTLTSQETQVELMEAQKKINKTAIDEAKKKHEEAKAEKGKEDKEKKAEPFDPDDVDPREANVNDIDVKPQLGIKSGDLVMGEIVDRYANGNYKIAATKKVNYRGSIRLVNFIGITRAKDISDKDEVNSDKMYEYRVTAYR